MIKKTKDLNNPLSETSSQRILLEEYKSIHNDYLRLRSEGVTRVNFFITSASVALGGVLVLGSSNNIPIIYFKIILLATLTLLAIIGLEIYYYLVQRDIGSDRHIRGLARIRNYFIEIDPSIKDYFVHTIYDIPTAYLIMKSSGMRRTTQIIEGFFVGSSLAILSTFLLLIPEVNFVIGLVAAILTITILEINARRKLGKASKRAEKEIKFDQNVNPK